MNHLGHTTALQERLIEFNSGDLEAREAIIEHTCERLRLRTRQMLRSFPTVSRWSQTDDVLQNAMIRLHKSLAQVKPESPKQFYGLAGTQIRRELIDLARRFSGAEGVGANHDTNAGETAGKSADTNYEPESLEHWSEFHVAVEQLSEDQQAVVGLLWYDGMSQPEASKVLGISLATLKRRWQAARLQLSEQLKSHWID
ncbi:RNA polymerase sigma factor [Rubripirellula reticaptiva]|uniref:RNA polymerase sigma factor n=1 Tax=Rubripirellula reticaptiva TaxID=2528013 RepID=A0A5C6ENS9_9BACT|nr:sigma-70 family RNA polymerase sigma factor [Rubripirellula reticaptiva]TWU49256.1 RNA polymerase sigma factor [Rubripirellula reticaptiva]